LADRTILLSSNTTTTLASTSHETRQKLQSAISHLSDSAPNTTRVSETGDFITRVDDARVVWREEQGQILVLTVFAPARKAMSQLRSIKFDVRKAERELKTFERFLQRHAFFKERKVVAVLKKCPHLCCLVGPLVAGLPVPNVYKFEFQIQGLFAADLVIGNLDSQLFVLVEFEGGEKNSLFGPKSTIQVRDWSRHTGHGFGQLIDWGWAIDDARNNVALKNAFGCEQIGAQFLACVRPRYGHEPSRAGSRSGPE
jgi:hypothetical protein